VNYMDLTISNQARLTFQIITWPLTWSRSSLILVLEQQTTLVLSTHLVCRTALGGLRSWTATTRAVHTRGSSRMAIAKDLAKKQRMMVGCGEESTKKTNSTVSSKLCYSYATCLIRLSSQMQREIFPKVLTKTESDMGSERFNSSCF
jgi:hypothetical protein